MHVSCDFAIFCLNFHTLLKFFWTNLLTQCTQLPVSVFCCFCISGFPALKMLQKFREKYIKNQRNRSFRKHQRSGGRPPPGVQEGAWRGPTLGHARGPPGCPVGPPDSPLRLYLPLVRKPSEQEPFFAKPSLFRRRRFKIGAALRSCFGTLPEGDTPSGRPSIAMDASRMCRE